MRLLQALAGGAILTGHLDGKVALVTGAASGIGRATALACARDGAKLVVSDITAEAGRRVVDEIETTGGNAIFVEADVSKSVDVARLIKAAVDTYGRLDCAHNNAGVEGPVRLFHEYAEAEWDQVIGVNLKGVFLCMKHEIAQMLSQGGGAIVNTSSVAGLVGAQGAGPIYSASKHGVVGLTMTAALAYAQQGIRVNAVCPGLVQTPMLERLLAMRPDLTPRYLAAEPIGRFATPDEIAAAVVWLCSDAASFVTGVALPVDGGYVAR
jgi:NAD(P)-dependent dehydrogenase (short-subunit alcohol dehydrogenase family)